ncbi:MAG: sucrose phosphorylase [Rudaea sp.]
MQTSARERTSTIKNRAMLITYPDSLGGNLDRLERLLRAQFAGLFPGGVHILPPFPSSGDRGFAPLTYGEIDPAFGSWQNIHRIAEVGDVMVDLMVNHISRRSPYFEDFVKKGKRSEYADLFLTLDKVWPGGRPRPEDLARIFLRKPGQPFSTVAIQENGESATLWTTFGTKEWSEQIDLDVRSRQTKELLAGYLARFAGEHIKLVRLDAVGYVVKKPGTSCFMVEPEIYEFLDWIAGVARSMGMTVIPEVHAPNAIQSRLAAHGYRVYDFVLPLLTLYTLISRDSRPLQEYLETCPRHQITMLDCHDGIPVLPDVEGILSVEQARAVVELCLSRGANLSRILSSAGQPEQFDAHQINCTYYSALGAHDDAYLAARAIQFFSPGVPQVYYVGLLAGENDPRAVDETGERRAINRHNYSLAEIDGALQKPVVQRLFKLIRFRNEYPAFDGDFSVLVSPDDVIALEWQKNDWQAQLNVYLDPPRIIIDYVDAKGELVEYRV